LLSTRHKIFLKQIAKEHQDKAGSGCQKFRRGILAAFLLRSLEQVFDYLADRKNASCPK